LDTAQSEWVLYELHKKRRLLQSIKRYKTRYCENRQLSEEAIIVGSVSGRRSVRRRRQRWIKGFMEWTG